MRGTSPRAARVFTFFSLFVLSTLSFTLVFGNVVSDVNTPPAAAGLSFHKRELYQHRRHFSHPNARADAPDVGGSSPDDGAGAAQPADPSPSPVSAPTTAPSASATQGSSPPSSPPAKTHTVQSSPPTETHSVSSSPAQTSNAVKAASSAPATTSSDADTSSTSSSQSSSSSASSSVASSLPSSSASSSPSTSGLSKTASASATATIAASATPATNAPANSATHNIPAHSAPPTQTVTANPTDIASRSSNGFFHNTSAVAGTFGTIGVLALIAGVGIFTHYLRKRREARRMSDEDDVAYFEPKYPVGHTYSDVGDAAQARHDLGSGPLGVSATDVAAMPATAEAYPDRAIHYGHSPDARADVYTPTDYGISYPPGTTFAPQNEEPDPSHNEDPYDPYAAYEPAQREYTPSPLSTSHATVKHPFADPANVRGQRAAPPVSYRGDSQYSPSVDSFYGTNSGGGTAL